MTTLTLELCFEAVKAKFQDKEGIPSTSLLSDGSMCSCIRVVAAWSHEPSGGSAARRLPFYMCATWPCAHV